MLLRLQHQTTSGNILGSHHISSSNPLQKSEPPPSAFRAVASPSEGGVSAEARRCRLRDALRRGCLAALQVSPCGRGFTITVEGVGDWPGPEPHRGFIATELLKPALARVIVAVSLARSAALSTQCVFTTFRYGRLTLGNSNDLTPCLLAC